MMFGINFSVWSQQEGNVQGLWFYEQLAHRDADYEIELQNINGQDELDYWVDQSNFERHLGKANFPAYLAYMKGEKEAYKSHLQKCNDGCSFSSLYLTKAREYLSLSDSEFLGGYNTDNVAQHIPRKRKLK